MEHIVDRMLIRQLLNKGIVVIFCRFLVCGGTIVKGVVDDLDSIIRIMGNVGYTEKPFLHSCGWCTLRADDAFRQKNKYQLS